MNRLKALLIRNLFLIISLCVSCSLLAQSATKEGENLSVRHQHIITISSFTATGEPPQLRKALHDGLSAGLTINEIKEAIVHLYAYCGFPRSITGLNILMEVLNERKAKGITDKPGKEATPLNDGLTKYERGKKTLEALTGQPQRALTGYAAFSPEIEIFLKEHLFADLFSRDILSYADREIATISALINLGGVEPMMQSHMRIALNLGITALQLQQLLTIIETKVGKKEADAGRRVLSKIQPTATTAVDSTVTDPREVFTKGQKLPETTFTGNAWLNPLSREDSASNIPVGHVTFEPGARTYWHTHAGGQVLLAIDGIGYYQEKGQPRRILHKGDAVKCPPNVPHWHGASPESHFAQVAITPNTPGGRTTWLQKVTEEEYNGRE